MREKARHMSRAKKVLLFSPSSHGGLAEYTFCQANALQEAGANVLCLTAPDFLDGRKTAFYRQVCLPKPTVEGEGFIRKIRLVWTIVLSRVILALKIVEYWPDLVLLDSYVEYCAPLWIWPHWLLAKLCGIRYAANLHDPVRNYVVGPEWWHRLSVRLAYLPLDFVSVHDKLPLPSPVPRGVRVTQVPHGLYDIDDVNADDAQMLRIEWGVRANQKVFLAFGYVRDGKNLDLAVQALAKVPEAFLVVAGSVAATNDRAFSFYQELALSIGVADRCRFFEGFVAVGDLGKFFASSDFVLLTYSASFHSQSGVLNIAARARKPVLASASECALVESVRTYRLGVTVSPDSVDAVVKGMLELLSSPPVPLWADYEKAASWSANASGILLAGGLTSEKSE